MSPRLHGYAFAVFYAPDGVHGFVDRSVDVAFVACSVGDGAPSCHTVAVDCHLRRCKLLAENAEIEIARDKRERRDDHNDKAKKRNNLFLHKNSCDMPLKAFGMHARVLYAAQGFRARTHYTYRFVRWIKYTTFARAMSRRMSNALYIKTASKKPPKSGLNAFMSRKSGGYPMHRAKTFLHFADMSQSFFAASPTQKLRHKSFQRV